MNKKPDLSHIRIFGSIVMLHIPKGKRLKWDRKAEKCILMGYPDDIKGYRVFNPRTQTFTTSRDVIIIEKKLHPESMIPLEDKESEEQICQDSVGDDSQLNDSFASNQSTDPNDETYIPSRKSIIIAEKTSIEKDPIIVQSMQK